MNSLKLVYMSPRELADNPANWRLHPESQTAALGDLIGQVGWAGACLFNERTQRLIDGHARKKIAIERGEQSIPVIVGDWSEEDERTILATLDPLAAMAGADGERLQALLDSVSVQSAEATKMLEELERKHAIKREVIEDEVPEPPADPITKPGDLWILGSHRLLCGDSTKAEDVARLMAGAKADMLLSDPPYGVSYVGKTQDALTIEGDDLDEERLSVMVSAAFDHAQAHCRPGAYWYATVPARPLHLVFAYDWKRRGILRQIMVWAKDTIVLGHSEYHYKHEPILFGWIPGDRHKNSDRTRTSLWQYDRPKVNREHPTMKPVALWSQAVTDGSRARELVYDPFLGSGTTLIAAEQLGRKCYGMEISPQYCDIICARWSRLTGLDPIRESDGVSFAKLKGTD